MKIRTLIIAAAGMALAGGCGSNPAPDIKLYALGSEAPIRLSSFKGKPVLIDFWATWCGPCRETMPELQKIFDEYGPKGLQVVAISAEAPATVERFQEQSRYSYPMYIDMDNSANDAFKITGIPTSCVIDRNGNVLWRGHPGDIDQLRRAVEAAMG